MLVKVRLFAMLRESAGRDSLELELTDGATVADALAALGKQPGLADLVERMPLRVAVNREYAAEATTIAPGDELAVIPPVSGGAPGSAQAPRVSASLTSEALSLDVVNATVADPSAGAIVSFQGVTRDVDRLEYEAYEPMAAERIERILTECATSHEVIAIAAHHRTGSVPLGEPSVVVAASSAHRPGAFAAAREAIDRIKAEVPIWKREFDGATGEWVEGALPEAESEDGR